jgi:hypothetical protein
VQPRDFSRVADTARSGVAWAADNDAFNGWSVAAERRYLRMLDALIGVPGCMWVTAPDVVGDAGLTDLLFEEWAPEIKARGLPVAYVAQEPGGEYEPRFPGWGMVDALFIGGATNEFRAGPTVHCLVDEAHSRGRLIHMGRVNSIRRLAYAHALGCTSVDGTGWMRWRKTHLPRALATLAALDHAPVDVL